MIELTEKNGRFIYINKDKIIKFYRVEPLWGNEDPFTEISLTNCFIEVKETPKDIIEILKSKS